MKIPVRACLETKGKQPLPLEHTYELPHLLQRHKQLLDMQPVQFKGQGEWEAGLFTVKGELIGSYTLQCSRCLAEVSKDFIQKFEERFDLENKVDIMDNEEDDELEEIHKVQGQYIDLFPFIEQEVLMSVPFIPVCESEAACEKNALDEGTDWTLLTEEKKKEKIDPRLAKLAELLDQNQENE